MAREYKDSGIEWIGRIPKDWKVCKLSYIYRFQTGATPPTNVESYFDGDIKWANISDLGARTIFDTNKKLSSSGVDKCSMNISPKGSLMYSFKLSVGIVSFCGDDMYTNEAIATFLEGHGYLPYLYYMAPIAIIHNANFNIYGAPILNQELIRGAKVIVPPLSEQKRIASYLDTKCAEIDSLVELQEQMIAQLTDYKQSVITEAVTKGLNPEAELVPSGIDWIGDIPKGWRICRFKSYISLVKEKVDNIDLPKINLENIESYSGKFIETDSKYDGEGYLFKPGDVLFGKLRPYLAKVFAPDYKGQAVGDFYVFRPSSKIETNFLKYAILSDSFISNVNSSTYGTKMPRANWDFISNVYIAIPPLEEQQTIITYLDAKCREIDSLIDLKRQKIEALKDYKKSIIFEAVTGKTD